MSSAFGQYLKLSIFGQSHGEALGVTLDGFPAGMTIDMEQLLAEMARRAPGQSLMTTARKEPDAPEFLSGVLNGRTTGQPICAIIRNTNQRSKDYGDGVDLVRPGHADYTGHVRYFGFEDWRGGAASAAVFGAAAVHAVLGALIVGTLGVLVGVLVLVGGLIGGAVLALVLAVVRAVFGAILAVVLHGSLLLS